MRPSIYPEACLLVVDHDPSSARELQSALAAAGYSQVHLVADARQLPPLYELSRPDLMVCNARAPHLEEALLECGLLAAAGSSPAPVGRPPRLAVVPNSRRAPLADERLPVRDVLRRPIDPREMLFRTESLLEGRFLRMQLNNQSQDLETRVRERTADVEEAEGEVLDRLALAAEYRDDTTGQHTRRVGQLAALISRQLGLSGTEVALLRRTAPLHDVGKIGLPDRILLKAGPLTRSQFEQMKAHTVVGARILAATRSPLLQQAAVIALTHHERWDGTGYPHGLQGEAIPLTGRIVAIADVWDALTHDRPYKPAWLGVDALSEVVRLSGRQFDPRIVRAFVQVCGQHGFAGEAASA